MAKIFKPRRALNSTIKTGSKKNTILASGELMVVSRGNAIGANNKHDIYMGDGVTTMENLKPALYGDTSTEDITITEDSSTSSTLALANVVTGRTLGALIGSLKRAIKKVSDEASDAVSGITTTLDERYAQIDHNHDGRYALIGHNHDSTYAKLNSSATFSDLYIINDNSSTGTSIGIQCSRNNKAKFTLTADAEGGGISLYSPNGTNFMHIDHNTDNSARLYFQNGSSVVTGSFGFDINKTVSYDNMKTFTLSVINGENVLTITDI